MMIRPKLTGSKLLILKPILATLLILIILFSAAGPALALSQADIDAINGNWVNWKMGDTSFSCLPNAAGNTSANTNDTPVGQTYFVGDSIGTQIDAGLKGSFGASFLANAASSRKLKTIPPSPDGLGAVDQDADFVKHSVNVVIELGTNTGGFTADSVGQMISKIRALAPNATIYWVDTAVVKRPDYAKSLSNVNSIIYAQSSGLKYTVISWNKKVFGQNSDPTNFTGEAADGGLISQADGLNVHLTATGITAMTDLITSAVKGGPQGGGNGCACTQLSGADNAEKIWNFLISKGLTPAQAAGVMGNLQAESGFRPDADQGGPGGVSGARNNAYGIAQWDSGRRPALEKAAADQGVPVSDLNFQLNYLFTESSGRRSRTYPNMGEWDGLKLQPDVQAAAVYWHYNFERSDDGPDRIQGRVNFGAAILIKFGSAAAAAGGTPC